MVQATRKSIVGEHQRIYYERFSSTLGSEGDSGGSGARGILSRGWRVLVVRIGYFLAPGSTPSAVPYAAVKRGPRRRLVAAEGVGGFLGTTEVLPPFQVMQSVPWEADGAVKTLVCLLKPRSGVRSGVQTLYCEPIVPSC